MKSSSSEESVRKRSHSVGGNQFANTLTAANICDINIDNLDTKQDLIGECKRPAIKIMEMASSVKSFRGFNFFFITHDGEELVGL